MQDGRRGNTQTIVAVSTIVSLLVGAVSLITYIQSSERRNTTMEVKMEVQMEAIKRMEQEWKEFKREWKEKKPT
jgi:hypothetical protein